MRAPRCTKVGTLTAFDAHLRARWDEGCRDAVVLWRELQERGFRGSYRTIQRNVARWRTVDEATHARRLRRLARRPVATACAVVAGDARGSALARSGALRTGPDERERPIRTAQALAVEFGRLVRAHDTVALEPWMVQAAGSALAEFCEFAAGLRRDFAAVRAAVELSWSNGQTEGQANKLKMLKRQMYGRASLGLLRQRMLNAG